MRNHFLISICLALVLAGCSKKTDTVFSETPDQRLEKTLSEFEAKLIGGQNGWIGTLEPKTGTAFYFYFIFKPDNRVSMLGDYNTTTATVLKESSWRLKALQQPTLIFDTYSYIHMLADPDPAVAGGEAGKGLYSDFEFAYDPTIAKQDTIILNGRFNGAKLTLVRATKEQGDNFLAGGLAKAFDFHKISALSTYSYRGANDYWGVGGQIFNYWKRFTIGGTTYEVDEGSFSPLDRTISFSWYVSGQKQSFTTSYHFGAGKVVLDKPFTAGSTVINEFSNIVWNDANKTLTVNLNNSATTTTFAGATAPLFYDTTSATRFRNAALSSSRGYWFTEYGFSSNGVFNVAGLDTLSQNTSTGKASYYFMIYQPAYRLNASSPPVYELLSPIFLNAAQTQLNLFYGYAASNNNATTPLIKDGLMNLNIQGSLYLGSYPSAGAWKQTENLLRANQFYLIRQADDTYDMVSSNDAKVWAHWQM